MSEHKIKQSLGILGKALARLEEAININNPKSSLIIDGTLHRFKCAIQLYSETLMVLLAAEGIEANTPKEALKQAYQIKWLDNETAWLQMLKDRNETSHIYNEATAKRIYDDIKSNYSELANVYKKLVKIFTDKGEYSHHE